MGLSAKGHEQPDDAVSKIQKWRVGQVLGMEYNVGVFRSFGGTSALSGGLRQV